MCPSPAARPVRLALERVRAFNMPRGARVLALGAPSLREGLVPHGFQIPAADPAVLDLAPESFDAAVIVNGTGREPWPRWTLQTVHGALKPGAPLALVAPLLFSAATLLDGAGLAEMARKQVRKLGPRDAAAPVSSPRRQRVGRVVAMLEHLGYRVESRSAHRVTGDLVLVARRESELFGDPPPRPWPGPPAHLARFERYPPPLDPPP